MKYKRIRNYILCQKTTTNCHIQNKYTMETIQPANFPIAFGQVKPEVPEDDDIGRLVIDLSPGDPVRQQTPSPLNNNEKINNNPKLEAQEQTDFKLQNEKTLKAKGKNGQIKRPMNAFMVWCRSERKKIMKENPHLKTSEASKLLSVRWKALPQEIKSVYVEEANRLQKMHRKEYPDYKYMPKKKPAQNVQFRVPIPRPVAQQWFDSVSSLDDERMTCFFRNYNYIKSHRPDLQMPLAIHLSFSCCLDKRDVKDFLENK